MAVKMSVLCDPRTVRTLESAIEALREQLATERNRCGQAEARADRAESRVEELRTALADARSSEHTATGEAAWFRSLMDEQRSWRLLRRLRWALRPVLVILLAFRYAAGSGQLGATRTLFLSALRRRSPTMRLWLVRRSSPLDI